MNILLLGATSDIARALAGQLAKRGDHWLLAGRDAAALEEAATDLGIRTGARTSSKVFDVEKHEQAPAFVREAVETLGGIDGVIVAFGLLGDQERGQREPEHAARIIDVNFTAAVALLEPLAAHLEERGAGWILGLSSVAGVRGRRSNYLYGAAKGAFTLYLEGIAHRLAARNVRVKIAKLGFVSSKMTRGMEMPGWAISTPEQAARGLVWLLNSPLQSAFIPWRWWLVMTLIRALPATLFNRTKL
jgi:decaprenylphospho-beta-D-erythro-pentofuranosid-2-ulose 2-reductase